MESDIVARLRSNARFFGLVKLGSRATIDPEFCEETATWFAEAADEIERLRTVVEAWQIYSSRAERDIAQLREERDEARREVCNMNESGLRMNGSDKQREAKRRGWDCFKENTE